VLERGASSLVKFITGEGPSTSGLWAAMPESSRVLGILALAVCVAAVVLLLAKLRGGERRRAVALLSVATGALVLPLALALAGVDYIEPRNLLGSLLPLLALSAAGLDLAGRLLARRLASVRPATAPAVALGLSLAMVALTVADPQLQRDDWRGLSKLVAQRGRPGVLLTQPPDAGKPLDYYLSRLLPRLAPPDFPCGVRTRRIVTLSSTKPEPVTGPFRLVAYHRTQQGWIVAIYVAARTRRVNAPELRVLDILRHREEARVVRAKRVEPRTAGPQLVQGRDRSPWVRGVAGRRPVGPGPCIAYKGTIQVRSS
jgi:hypothetical protein